MVKLFGTTIKESLNAFNVLHFGDGNQSVASSDDKFKVIGRLAVTIFLLFLATYLFTHDQQTAGGTITGAISGYWLK